MFNVGVIGLGMGKVHAKGIQKTAQKYEGKSQPNLYSLCEINKEKLEKTGEELGVTHLYTDYRELLADPLLDAVVIASPDQDHRQMAEDALKAGKHVLCEKPLALTQEDIAAIVEAAKTATGSLWSGRSAGLRRGSIRQKRSLSKARSGS